MRKNFITLPLSIYNFFKINTRGSDVPAPLVPKRLRPIRDLP